MAQDTPAPSPTPQPQAAPSGPAAAVLARVQALGARLQVSPRGRLGLVPGSAYRQLTDAERATLRECREELRALVLSGYTAPVAAPEPPPPPPRPAPEPEPVVFAYGVRVTAAHVAQSLLNLGDQMFVDYHAGRISKAVAYEMTRCALMQSIELRAGIRRMS